MSRWRWAKFQVVHIRDEDQLSEWRARGLYTCAAYARENLAAATPRVRHRCVGGIVILSPVALRVRDAARRYVGN